MMFDTINSVRKHYSFAEWKKLHDSITPVRGRSPEIRPLGARRDADKFSIRMDSDDCVELVLYQTPVVKWYSDERVEVNCGQWTSEFTCRFVEYLMPGIRACHRNREMVMHCCKESGGMALHIVQKNETAVFDFVRGRMVMRGEIPQRYSLVLNRKRANIVRARYKGLTDYFTALSSLLKESPHSNYTGVTWQFFQDNDVVLYTKTGTSDGNGYHWGDVPCTAEEAELVRIRSEVWNLGQGKVHPTFMELLSSSPDDSDDVRISKYMKASAWVLGFAATGSNRWGARVMGNEGTTRDGLSNDVRVSLPAAKKKLDELILKVNAVEVLERKPVSPDRLPNTAYANWVADISTLPITQK
jgi:hypothetical protein